MPKLPDVDHIGYLVRRKFPGLLPVPPLAKKYGTGNFSYEEPEEEWTPPSQETIEQSKKYREKLSLLSKAEIKRLYNAEIAKQRIEDEEKRFFNKPDANADFEYWAKMAHWTLEEATALSFGKNPHIVNWSSLSQFYLYSSPFVREYGKLRELTSRALKWNKLYDPVLPPLFINWAKQNEISVPSGLVEKVAARQGAWTDWKKMYEDLLEKNNSNVETANQLIAERDGKIRELEGLNLESKPLHTKEKETLLKLIIGMATDTYGYDPSASRSPVPKEVSGILAQKGIAMDPDTVRKWLKEAADYLPTSNNSKDAND